MRKFDCRSTVRVNANANVNVDEKSEQSERSFRLEISFLHQHLCQTARCTHPLCLRVCALKMCSMFDAFAISKVKTWNCIHERQLEFHSFIFVWWKLCFVPCFIMLILAAIARFFAYRHFKVQSRKTEQKSWLEIRFRFVLFVFIMTKLRIEKWPNIWFLLVWLQKQQSLFRSKEHITIGKKRKKKPNERMIKEWQNSINNYPLWL